MPKLWMAGVVLGLCCAGWLWAVPACAETEAPPAASWKYQLLLDEGVPVVVDYMLGEIALKPALDTGCLYSILLPPAVYDKLKVGDETNRDILAVSGKAWDVDEGLVQLPLLGSQQLKWFPASPMEPAADELSDSLFSLDTVGSDYVIFLLSRKELLLTDLAPGVVEEEDSSPLKALPYFDCASGMLVAISCAGRHYAAQIDTGAAGTSFNVNFVAQHPELFTATGETYVIQAVNDEFDAPAYNLQSGIAICGVAPEDDLPLAGEICAFPAFDNDGNPPPPHEPGDPSSLPYARLDTPAIAPVALIGMDVLGAYDFMLDLRNHMLFYWSPELTPELFPATDEK
jgi:hypothetical protein